MYYCLCGLSTRKVDFISVRIHHSSTGVPHLRSRHASPLAKGSRPALGQAGTSCDNRLCHVSRDCSLAVCKETFDGQSTGHDSSRLAARSSRKHRRPGEDDGGGIGGCACYRGASKQSNTLASLP